MTLQDIVATMRAKGYIVNTQPYKLNVVGIRSSNVTSLYYDDQIAFFWYNDKGKLEGKVCPATTDPSVYYLRDNPMNRQGTAILKSGQYVDTYKIDYHDDRYLALCQRLKPVTVIRDADRNDLLNFFAETSTGMYGINIHRSSYDKSNELLIGPDSAGCQVFRNNEDFLEMMKAAEISKNKYGNKFTYTLIDERDFVKTVRNISLLGVGLLLIGVGVYIYYKIRK
jgi:hypothetical protein